MPSQQHSHQSDAKFAPTFAYAIGTNKRFRNAKFDIRDQVCMRVGGFQHGQVLCDSVGREFVVVGVRPVKSKLRLWLQPLALDKPGAIVFEGRSLESLHAKGTVHQLHETSIKDYDAVEDSDEEELPLCSACHMPLGEVAYDGKARTRLHGECLAQSHVRVLNKEVVLRQEKELALKKERHAEYKIGWKASQIPSNVTPATKLGCPEAPQGMCCLSFDTESRSLKVKATIEPSAAVNLEYLSLALQVRVKEGKEPFFSLDPIRSMCPSNDSPDVPMQAKRFEPEWLAGTSMGEVMFQADYHLKGLSMGEYEQPVLGMKSCFDLLSNGNGEYDKDWSAREWFVVRQANVLMSEDDVLLPYVKMGIEAREQIVGADGMEDAPLTRAGHPLVKYAKEFTHNFDLIAERKSVIHELREVAKMAVLAKYLIENDAQLDDSWFHLANTDAEACCLEVPQLWNERFNAEIHVQDGKIQDAEKATSHKQCVYGGVDFGIDKFRMSGVPAAPPSGVSYGLDKFSLGAGKRAAVRPTLSGTGVATRMSALFAVAPAVAGVHAPVMGQSLVDAGQLQVSQAAALRGVGLRGVDLNLDQFDLSGNTVGRAAGKLASSLESAEARVPIGSVFWSTIDNVSKTGFKNDDKKLLKDVFNPCLSDRRDEGDKFVPPVTNSSYIEQLRNLVKEEDLVQEDRKQHFFSKAFKEDNAGPLFPSSWQASCQIAHAWDQDKTSGLLHARPDYKAQAASLSRVLQSAPSAFDKITEDGTRYRIYRIGSLEVRTIQEVGNEEFIGAVFSVRTPQQASIEGRQSRSANEQEEVVKATEYVEGSETDPSLRRNYVVLETSCGNIIMTERLADGSATWEENPQTLEVRNSFAKVFRTVDCDIARVAVREMKNFQSKSNSVGLHLSASKCKRYARSTYDRAQALQVASKATQ